jgi:hypothetical protein
LKKKFRGVNPVPKKRRRLGEGWGEKVGKGKREGEEERLQRDEEGKEKRKV